MQFPLIPTTVTPSLAIHSHLTLNTFCSPKFLRYTHCDIEYLPSHLYDGSCAHHYSTEMAASDPATVATGRDVTDSVEKSSEAGTKQQEQAAQTIQVQISFLEY